LETEVTNISNDKGGHYIILMKDNLD